MRKPRLLGAASALLILASLGAKADEPLKIPNTVHLPDIDPLIPNCADPAADHFITIDMWARAPAGATQVAKLHAWMTPDGIFHWPLVMRVRNLGDQPFIGKPGKQRAVVTEDDVIAKTKGRQVGSQKFDRIEPRGSLLVHFEFTAPRAAVEAQHFHRIYTLSLKLDESDAKALAGPYGDCHPKNNSYFIEIDGSRKGWIFGH
ncbi:MAG: hypothetical protein GC190_20355 [Alphaproteobacteria bacterium]|nr:hypothetical protein [Alphaproteobacteria bacterium]